MLAWVKESQAIRLLAIIVWIIVLLGLVVIGLQTGMLAVLL